MPRPILITFTALHHGARWMRREAEARAESTHRQIFGGSDV